MRALQVIVSVMIVSSQLWACARQDKALSRDLEAPPDLTLEAGARNSANTRNEEQRPTKSDLPADAIEDNTDNAESQTEATTDGAIPEESEQAFDVTGTPLETWSNVRKFWHDAGIEIESDDVQDPMIQTVWVTDSTGRSRERFKVWVKGDRDVSHVRLVRNAEVLVRKDGELLWTTQAPNMQRHEEMTTKLRKALEGEK